LTGFSGLFKAGGKLHRLEKATRQTVLSGARNDGGLTKELIGYLGATRRNGYPTPSYLKGDVAADTASQVFYCGELQV
jgi:hypothetical protein